MTSIKEALEWANKILKPASASAALDADVLLTFVTGEERAFFVSHPESVIKEDEWRAFRKLVERRKEGEPVAYLTGSKEFYGRTFRVTPAVLIPRPATEHLVDAVLDEFNDFPVTVADIGTGSGAVAVALKIKAPRMHVLATDISKEALEIAKENADANNVKIATVHGDLLEPIRSQVDGIVANLPYLTSEEMAEPTIAFEPKTALDGGPDGLGVFHRFFIQAPKTIKPNGCIFLEIGATQTKPVSEMARSAFPNAKIEVRKDLEKFDRVLIIRLQPKKKTRVKAAFTFFNQYPHHLRSFR